MGAATTLSPALLLALFIGFLAGLRSLTPAAATAWAARLGWLKLSRPLSLIGTTTAVVILTLLALGELVADKLPQTPSRTAPPGLLARLIMGALTGACAATAGAGGAVPGALLGVVGAIAGTFLGYNARTQLVKFFGTSDFVIAILEDLVTIGGSFWLVSPFQ